MQRNCNNGNAYLKDLSRCSIDFNDVPDNPDSIEELYNFLHNIEKIIICTATDNEISDGRLTYAAKLKNLEKIIWLSSDNHLLEKLENLFTHLKKSNNQNILHLVLMGHANQKAEVLAQMSPSDIAQVCEKYPQIQHVHLLGCQIAQAKKTEQEKKMLQNYHAAMNAKNKFKYGFQTTLNAPEHDEVFDNKFRLLCLKNNLNGVYVLNKDNETAYRLIIYKIQADKTLSKKIKSIPENKKYDLLHILKNQHKALPFPKKNNEANILRNHKTPLDTSELQALRDLNYEQIRFHPAHPKYKKDKTLYPFLNSLKVNLEELKISFMKKVADEILNETTINWDITLYGTTKVLHVDTQTQSYFVTESIVYNPYPYTMSLFASKQANIDYTKLKTEYKNEIKEFQKKDRPKDETQAKQLVVTLKGRAP